MNSAEEHTFSFHLTWIWSRFLWKN